jgi:LmbE family N-acetylglucosaminyl deacetylase
MTTETLTAAAFKSAVTIVAHPDDEVLWAGGTLLQYLRGKRQIFTLCRANDRDRAPRFYNVLQELGAGGAMADLDDGPEQQPLPEELVGKTILSLLQGQHFDIMLTHHPDGEYTRHRRHEEIGRSVIKLWHAGRIYADELWVFAYEDGGRAYYPVANRHANIFYELPEAVWQKKYALITGLYGFAPDSWEARTTPAAEAFWRFTDKHVALAWLYDKPGI